MRSIRYIGRFAEVEVEVAPAIWRAVKRGESIEVADGKARSLLEQERNWQDPDAKPARKSPARKKPPSKPRPRSKKES